jgi:hypothetical protein
MVKPELCRSHRPDCNLCIFYTEYRCDYLESEMRCDKRHSVSTLGYLWRKIFLCKDFDMGELEKEIEEKEVEE